MKRFLFLSIVVCLCIGCAHTTKRMGDFYVDNDVDPNTHEQLGTLRYVTFEEKSKDGFGHDVTVIRAFMLDEYHHIAYALDSASGSSPGFFKVIAWGSGQAVINAAGEIIAFRQLPDTTVRTNVRSNGGNATNSNTNTSIGGSSNNTNNNAQSQGQGQNQGQQQGQKQGQDQGQRQGQGQRLSD